MHSISLVFFYTHCNHKKPRCFHGVQKATDVTKLVNNDDQEIHLRKTKFIGFSEKVEELFNVYLTERNFFDSLENVLSNSDTMKCKAPYRTTLGLLFNLSYITPV